MGIEGIIDTLCDIRRLLTDIDIDGHVIGTDAEFRRGIADFTDDIACDFFIIELRFGCHFARNHNAVSCGQSFDSRSRKFVLFEGSIQNSIGNSIADLVRMSFRNGFRCK